MTKVDLRSDTVTHPSPEMREAIANAEIGDDVFNDDPSVNKLEEIAAAKIGKEASVFVMSIVKKYMLMPYYTEMYNLFVDIDNAGLWGFPKKLLSGLIRRVEAGILSRAGICVSCSA